MLLALSRYNDAHSDVLRTRLYLQRRDLAQDGDVTELRADMAVMTTEQMTE